jgi:uncharacterized protein (TIGR03083 family)
MTEDDVRPWVQQTYEGLAELLTSAAWEAPTLCTGWQVRHLVAHVTMPARLTPEQFGAELAAARGDFGVLSDTVAARDAALPPDELLAELRSPRLHGWLPPGGGATGALTHAVVHSLDVTLALDVPPTAPAPAVAAVLDSLADGTVFGVDPGGLRLAAVDTGWTAGEGAAVEAGSGALVALLAGRTLPDGRALPRVSAR